MFLFPLLLTSLSSSSCHAASTDIPDSLSPLTLSFIASGRFSGLHPVSSHSCCMYVRAGRPAFARLYVGVHWSTSLMSSSLLLQQCPACLIRQTFRAVLNKPGRQHLTRHQRYGHLPPIRKTTSLVFLMGGRWPYRWWLVGCCRQGLFNTARKVKQPRHQRYGHLPPIRKTTSLYIYKETNETIYIFSHGVYY